MATAPVPLEIPPGVLKTTTHRAAKGRYVDCDKVRFQGGQPEKIGGWALLTSSQLDGVGRGAYAWTTTANIDLLHFGTYRRLYAYGTDLDDITPLDDSGTLGADPFASVNLSTTITVHDVAHGRDVGAIVIFDGATAFAGITIDGEYVVVTVVDADHYTITHSVAANATTTGGGAAVTYEYEINPGEIDTAYDLGYGSGPYGGGTYGTARSSSTLVSEMRYWSIGNYGDELIACPSGGTIYLWDEPAAADRAVALAGAPASVRYTFVTAERYIFALGSGPDANTPMDVNWPDLDDPTDWTPADDNTANNRRLQDGNKLMAGTVFNDAVNVIWSDNAIFVAQFLPGNDEIYDIPVVKTGVGLVGPAAFCVTPLGVFWLSGSSVYLYNGSVDEAPNFIEIKGWFLDNFRRDKAHKAVMTYNQKKNEVQLHYTSIASSENDSYLFVSLDTMSWAPGTMMGDWGETAIAVRRNPLKNIYAAHADGYIYEHENGVDSDIAGVTAALPWFIETGIVALQNGAIEMDVIGYEPDFDRQTGDITLEVSAFDRPRDDAEDNPIDDVSVTIAETDTLVDFMLGGRYIKCRLSGEDVGSDFRLGIGSFEAGPAGQSR